MVCSMYVCMFKVYKRIFLHVCMTCRIRIFDLYPIVFNLFVRCFLILFGGQFGRVSHGTLPILATIHAVLIKLHREYMYVLKKLFLTQCEI